MLANNSSCCCLAQSKPATSPRCGGESSEMTVAGYANAQDTLGAHPSPRDPTTRPRERRYAEQRHKTSRTEFPRIAPTSGRARDRDMLFVLFPNPPAAPAATLDYPIRTVPLGCGCLRLALLHGFHCPHPKIAYRPQTTSLGDAYRIQLGITRPTAGSLGSLSNDGCISPSHCSPRPLEIAAS